MANYNFIFPVDENVSISSFYGYRDDPIKHVGAKHYGLDFACKEGTEVFAVANGKIIWSGCSETYGNTVVIEHNGGYLTLSAHLKCICAKIGENVKQGQKIGYSGSTGKRVRGAHLHFETIDGNEKYLGKPVKDLIKTNNGIADKNGFNHIGVNGTIGRYNVFTGELLDNVE